MDREVSHYVVTAHPPGGVLHTVKCNFMSSDREKQDVVVGKSRRLEIRQLKIEEEDEEAISSPFPVILSIPINGRITCLVALPLASHPTSLLFMTTDQHQYAVIGYNANLPNYVETFASGNLKDEWNVMGDLADTGPLVAVDPHNRCIVMHLYDGLITIFPILAAVAPTQKNVLGPVFHARLEEKLVLQIAMLHHLDASMTPPHLCLLHQDARGAQHISTHVVDLPKSQLWSMTSMAGNQSMLEMHLEWLKKPRIDGGSSLLIPVPPVAAVAAAPSASTTSTSSTQQASGGVVILGQRQITFCGLNHHKVMPIPPALILSWDALPPDVSGMPRFLLGDEFGNLHMLTLITQHAKVVALQLDTLGSCTLSNTLQYLDQGLVFCGSTLGDSQLVQIHDEPIPVEEDDMDDDAALELGETTYLSVEEEYTHLGPIVDFDLVPMTGSNRTEGAQSQVVTASGSSKSGSLRVVQNGTGMKEYAAVELGGIQNMWSLREKFADTQDAYLVQSYVGETRVLGVTSVGAEDDAMSEDGGMEAEEDVGGTLEEVFLPGLESSASTLFVTNVVGNLFLQITETQLRLVNEGGTVLDTMEPDSQITVATANEGGQVAVALRGGKVLYIEVIEQKFHEKASKKMDREVSCLDINPFLSAEMCNASLLQKRGQKSSLVAVGLWDDFTVRLLSLQTAELSELLLINLSTGEEDEEGENGGEKHRSNRNNMMARSLCLATLDMSSSSNSSAKSKKVLPGADMLFVGLGDGTLVSFTVIQEGSISVQSKKEVSLGTQRINLVPLFSEKGGSCVLATGDRPTVIYLAGTSSGNYNSKLCYSNVNISPADDGDTNDVSRPATRESISVNSATPFFNPLLFDAMGQDHYSLCIADDVNMRLGVIDDIQKLHVSTYRLGMAPRRVVHCPEGRLFAVGCIESGIKQGSAGGNELAMGNCIRFLDDTSFEDVHRIDLDPFEMILSMVSATLRPYKPTLPGNVSGETASIDGMDGEGSKVEHRPVLIIGTAYAMHDEDEPTKGRIIVLSCGLNETDGTEASRSVKTVTELEVRGGVYSMCQFYEGMLLGTVNSKTQVFQLQDDGTGGVNLAKIGVEHHGHILSLFVSSKATKSNGHQESFDGKETAKLAPKKEMLALVGDLMRSISLVQYYSEHETLEEIARDFNANWTTAVTMLTDDIYLGGENWNNLFVLKRNAKAQNEEVRCRLDTVGEFHLGEMCNKFMSGSLVMPSNSGTEASARSGSRRRSSILASPMKRGSVSGKVAGSQGALRTRRPGVAIGSQTLFGTVDGTLGVILGLDGPTAAFFSCMQRSLQTAVTPVGNFNHQQFRAFNAEQRIHPSHGFVDGDLIESFLDLDKSTMQKVVDEMNRDGGWEVDESSLVSNDKNDSDMKDADRVDLMLEDVLAVVEEMTMLH
ncbi:unnamed protein product [Cylindrotheca closterium]|uniref:DNA damage-binding protein 1 n=1 Tax=Cylindrotheca closterium TaxID=2856 RepID=A0AAD2CFJ5_9STRA|nr:unnamed protein product [Cylindrotheca closterium]